MRDARCAHDEARRTPEVWATWRFVGYHELLALPDDGLEGGTLEMRDCPFCMSTLALEVDGDGKVMFETATCACGKQCDARGKCQSCIGTD